MAHLLLFICSVYKHKVESGTQDAEGRLDVQVDDGGEAIAA